MHLSVLLKESIDLLNVEKGKTYIDATFGYGGHTKEILKRGGKVIAMDQDLTVLPYAEKLTEEFANDFVFIRKNFLHIDEILQENNIAGVIYDLGVSSMQLDTCERGFSFNKEAKLDMRMNQDLKISAFEIINEFAEKKLADIIFEYGDEHFSRTIARNIIKYRSKKTIENTTELADIVKDSYPKKHFYKIHPATKTFQALRIFINNELSVLEQSLEKVIFSKQQNLKLSVISFHSGEDSIVKNIFNKYSVQKPDKNKYKKTEHVKTETEILTILTKKPITPTEEEIKQNIRARSAKLRAAFIS